jgi:hypothetical protein
MAERRMFAKTIIDSDAFLDMPMSARLLYYDLGMRADDDGFVNAPKKIMRTIGATADDMNILIARKFIIPFDNGVVVIKAWRINNYLRSDRYNETKYLEEKAQLSIDKNGMYHIENEDGIPCGIPTVDTGKDSIDKNSIVKDSIDICTDPQVGSAPNDEVVMTFLLNDKTEFEVTQSYVDEMQKCYPYLDIMQELRQIKAWCLNNPSKRKTRKGALRFMGGWFERSQNKGNGKATGNQYNVENFV